MDLSHRRCLSSLPPILGTESKRRRRFCENVWLGDVVQFDIAATDAAGQPFRWNRHQTSDAFIYLFIQSSIHSLLYIVYSFKLPGWSVRFGFIHLFIHSFIPVGELIFLLFIFSVFIPRISTMLYRWMTSLPLPVFSRPISNSIT